MRTYALVCQEVFGAISSLAGKAPVFRSQSAPGRTIPWSYGQLNGKSKIFASREIMVKEAIFCGIAGQQIPPMNISVQKYGKSFEARANGHRIILSYAQNRFGGDAPAPPNG